MIIDFSQAARADLAAIGDWIARENPARAASFVDELIDRAEELAESFNLYPESDNPGHRGVRRMNHRHYRIWYRVLGDTVEILHVHHGRRDTPQFD